MIAGLASSVHEHIKHMPVTHTYTHTHTHTHLAIAASVKHWQELVEQGKVVVAIHGDEDIYSRAIEVRGWSLEVRGWGPRGSGLQESNHWHSKTTTLTVFLTPLPPTTTPLQAGSGSEAEDDEAGEEEKRAESLANHLEVPSQKEVRGRRGTLRWRRGWVHFGTVTFRR